jgi:hypothetical protein
MGSLTVLSTTSTYKGLKNYKTIRYQSEQTLQKKCFRGFKYLVITDCEAVYTLIVVSFKTTNGMGGACGAYEAEDKCIQ